ncbi:MAG: hypothetical protein IID55_13535 [Proteobacteria bacterium]|nr:hypothetical protein [Pseudomonadota bacterium]
MPDLDIPPVPPVWNWIGLALAFMSAVAAIGWLWQRFFADRWAALSRDNAIRRARRVAAWASTVEDLREDTPRLIATCAVCVLWILGGIGLLLVTLNTFQTLAAISVIVPMFLIVISYLFILIGFFILNKLVWPVANFKSYREETLARIVRLLDKADFSNEEKTEFFKQFAEEFCREHNGGEK